MSPLSLTVSSRRGMILRLLGRRFGHGRATCFNLDVLLAASSTCDDQHNHNQLRYKWAPPAYRKQEDFDEDRTKKRSRRGVVKSRNARRSRSPFGKHHLFGDNRKQQSQVQENLPSSSRDTHQRKYSRREQFPGIELQLMQENLIELLYRYQSMLEDEIDAKTVRSLENQAESVNDDEDDDDVELWWSQVKMVLSELDEIKDLNESMTAAKLHETEQTYKEISMLLHRLILAWTKEEVPTRDGATGIVEDTRQQDEEGDKAVGSLGENTPAPHDVAEQLFLAFLKFQSDRTQLVSPSQATADDKLATEEANEEEQPGWTDWLFNTFVQSPGEKQQDTAKDEDSQNEQQETVREEKDSAFKDYKRLPLKVFQCIIDGELPVLADDIFKYGVFAVDYDYHWKQRKRRSIRKRRSQLIDLAQRLTSLFDQVVRHLPNQKVDPELLDLVLRAHAQVGLYESAFQAECLYNVYGRHRSPAMLFHTVLKAYCWASILENTASLRAQAAKRAEELLNKRQRNTIRNQQRKDREVADRSALGSHRHASLVVVMSYKLVLQAFVNAGVDAIPDMSEMADRLMELLMGKEDFQKLLDGSWDSMVFQPDLGLLHCLIVVYAQSNQDGNMDRAKLLLQYMETKSTEKSRRHSVSKEQDANDEEAVVFPNLFSYNAVLAGLLRQSNRVSKGQHALFLENAHFGTGLLDTMATTLPNSSPDHDTFSMVLKLWARSKSLQSGEQAENILSRMEISSACSGYAWTIDHATYTAALRCWCQAAVSGTPNAAQRAKKLLEKMQAQCRPVSNVANDFVSKTFSHAELTAVYTDDLRPSISDYNLVIETCARTYYSTDRGIALEVAFDTYNGMVGNGVCPNDLTYQYLLMCCTNLLRDDPERRMDLSRQVFRSACDQDRVSTRVLSMLQKANPDLYNSYKQSGRREKNQVGNGVDTLDSEDDEMMHADSVEAAMAEMNDSEETEDGDKEAVVHFYPR